MLGQVTLTGDTTNSQSQKLLFSTSVKVSYWEQAWSYVREITSSKGVENSN